MSAAQNTVDTVNAAASAIVNAESRVQPGTVQKKRWRIRWSLYWCFGTHKKSKKISHAVLVPEPVVPGASAPVNDNPTHPNTILLPFIAPPSSPASFLLSDPPSATQSPAGTLSLTSLSIHAYSLPGTTNIFTVGPYAYETQLVSPPVFSTFTTEPSTASFTPPPEPVQLTSPSSPEVPFAQLLASSLGRSRRNSGPNQKITLSQYEFQPYYYQGSPVSNLISPGSVVSNSGTSSPFPDKPSIVFRIEEVPKLLAFKNFYTCKGGSRLGSGSLTPDGIEPVSQDSSLIEDEVFEATSAANSKSGSQNVGVLIDHRVSFELTGEKDVSQCSSHVVGKGSLEKTDNCSEHGVGEVLNGMQNEALGEGDEDEEQCSQKYRSISLGSIKEFNFDNAKGDLSEKPATSSDWWANEKVVGEELGPDDNWTFFPVLQSRVG